MYIILSPNSTTIFGWWKIEKKTEDIVLDTLEQPPHQSYSSSEPWTIIHFVTTIYLSRKPSLMVKSLLLMVKLPRIHNKNHQRFYIPTKNYPTIPQWRSSMWISPVVADFHWDNQPYPAPPPRSRSVCRTARPLGQAHSPAQALDKMFDITASSGRWGRYFF